MHTPDLTRLRHLALDMDGTIYLGGRLFDFTLPFLAQLERIGIGHTFLTNNSSRSHDDYLRRLQQLGIQAEAHQLYTSTLATIDFLQREHPGVCRLDVLGTVSLRREFAAAGFEVVAEDAEPDAVVVGFDTGLAYDRLCRSAWWIARGKPFIATHPDRICPTDQPTILVDCGSICAALEHATGRRPDKVLGKPDPAMLAGIRCRHGLQADEIAMVGDRLYTDIAMARRAGALGVLVLTGEATIADVEASAEPPDLVVPSLQELGELLAAARAKGGRAG